MGVEEALYAEARERAGDDFRSTSRAKVRIAGTLAFAEAIVGHRRWRDLGDPQVYAVAGAARTQDPAPDGVDPDSVEAILTRARELDR